MMGAGLIGIYTGDATMASIHNTLTAGTVAGICEIVGDIADMKRHKAERLAAIRKAVARRAGLRKAELHTPERCAAERGLASFAAQLDEAIARASAVIERAKHTLARCKASGEAKIFELMVI